LFGLSYDLNNNLIGFPYCETTTNTDNAFESEISRPNKTVLFADHGDGTLNTQGEFYKANGNKAVQSPCFDGNYRWWQEAPTAVHTGGQNWSFCDGHVKWFTLKQYRNLSFLRCGLPHKASQFSNPTVAEYLD
jgi:prepilin-type processing-associated H-X9-DG protein